MAWKCSITRVPNDWLLSSTSHLKISLSLIVNKLSLTHQTQTHTSKPKDIITQIALYNIWPGKRSRPFLQPQAHNGMLSRCLCSLDLQCITRTNTVGRSSDKPHYRQPRLMNVLNKLQTTLKLAQPTTAMLVQEVSFERTQSTQLRSHSLEPVQDSSK